MAEALRKQSQIQWLATWGRPVGKQVKHTAAMPSGSIAALP
jgi:hypothetical protein